MQWSTGKTTKYVDNCPVNTNKIFHLLYVASKNISVQSAKKFCNVDISLTKLQVLQYAASEKNSNITFRNTSK